MSCIRQGVIFSYLIQVRTRPRKGYWTTRLEDASLVTFGIGFKKGVMYPFTKPTFYGLLRTSVLLLDSVSFFKTSRRFQHFHAMVINWHRMESPSGMASAG